MAQPLYFEYTPQSGDSLHTVIHRLYGWSPPWQQYQEIERGILAMNPHLKRTHPLDPGVVLRLADFTQPLVPRVGGYDFMSAPLAPEERKQLWAMAWAEHSGLLLNPGGVALGAGSNLLSGGNLDLLRQIGDEYAAYKNGRMTKGQYDYRRRLLIEQFRNNAGPFERWMFRGLQTQQAIRIARYGGLPYDHNIRQHVGRLRHLGSLASKGGVVLTGIGVTTSCAQIAHAADRKEKNEIFVETVASTSAGVFFGGLMTVFLVSNPVGWGTALVLALGSAGASWMVGKGATHLYDKYGNEIDLVNGSGVDKICS